MNGTINIFVELGKRLRLFGKDERTKMVLANAVAENEWFAEQDVYRAIDAICEEYLDEEKLTLWAAQYPTPAQPRKVAIVMAGNIPLVGFFDMMCVVLCGYKAYVKPSSKDSILTNYIIAELKDISKDIHIEEYNPTDNYDMIIATGGAEAAKHFSRQYSSIPAIIRGSRHSVAILTGKESDEELQGLQRDIFTYNGLGCRNVSLIFLPRGAELNIPAPKMNPMYHGNYLHNKAMRQMMGEAFRDMGEYILVEERSFSSNISQINYCFYDAIEQVEQWLAENDEQIQCVVANITSHPRRIAFGRAQYPTLWDYADGVDVMRFLTE